jgi:hypothetical protein
LAYKNVFFGFKYDYFDKIKRGGEGHGEIKILNGSTF